MVRAEVWLLAAPLAAVGGWTDWRSRRIPNWLTVPGLAIGIAVNSWASGWPGLRASLLGAAMGLALLLPFVLVRSLGAGDWKLVGALGAFLGPDRLLASLFVAVLVAGIMALVLVIWKRQLAHTLRNLGRILKAFLTLRLPDPEFSLDNPKAIKVPFGVAMAMAVLLYSASQVAGIS